MKYFGIILMLAAVLGATGCSRVKAVPQDVAQMTAAAFAVPKVTIKAGQKVKFIDQAGAAPHVLVVGTGGTWQADSNAPTELNNDAGLNIAPGQEIDVTFPNAGTFSVTCKVHPAMLLSVVVNP